MTEIGGIEHGPERAIEMSRRLARKLVAEVLARGVEPIDALIGLAYAVHDTASDVAGDSYLAINWMRDAADQMERQIMEDSRGKPATH